MASYNEVIKFLSDFSTAYFPLKSFGNGEVSELVETFKQKDAEYPKMWAQDMPNTTATGEEVFKFRIYMVDQVATLKEKTDTTLGEDNTNEIKSNMRQFCLDLVSYLLRQTNYPEITTDKNIVLTSVVDEFNDKLTGWYFDLNIRQAFRFSSCILPMDGIAPPPSGVCDDGTVTIKDSAGNTLYVKTVASGGVEDQTIIDATNTFNGNSINGVLAQGNKDIIVQDNSPIPVQLGTVITNDKDELIIEVNASSPPPLNTSNTYKSGATVSFQSQDDGDKKFGRGFDFLTLNFNNGFSNTNRFTDDLGTQVYLSGAIVDWSTWNQVSETVTVYFKTPESSTTLTNHINSQPYTKLSLGDWYVCNVKQLINIFNYGIFRNYLNYAPFNHSMSLTPDRVWTSTRENVSNGIFVFTSGVSVSNQSSAYRAFVCRVYTLAELGL